MDYRQRFLNCLRGKPIDRLPFIEIAKFNHVRDLSDFGAYLSDEQDPIDVFGFDNTGLPTGYERVPVDPYAVPRFEQTQQAGGDGYRRGIDDRFGRVIKKLPATSARSLSVRIFENHVLRAPADWTAVKERFRLSTEGRFPPDWKAWCAHSRSASHPIVLGLPDPAATMANLMGFDEPTGLIMNTVEHPDWVHEMVGHFTELNRLCAEKALREARVDMVLIGSDLLPMLGPNMVRDVFLRSHTAAVAQAAAHGIDLICLQGRGPLLTQLRMFQEIGVAGVKYVEESGARDDLPDMLRRFGNSLFYLGAIDGRVLLRTREAIEQEVERKVALAKRYRMIPCLHVTHLLPAVRFNAYKQYVQSLRKAIER